MKHKFKKTLMAVLPQKTISKAVGKMAKSKLSKVTIKPYAKLYNIDLKDVEKSIEDYHNLTDFFIRKMKKSARPINEQEDVVISPVDGLVTQMGEIKNGTLIQAKGCTYSVEDLVVDKKEALKYKEGYFMTVYLSPKDYHRIHMPCEGKVNKFTYVPGRLYPVNEIGVEGVHNLFTKNERVITHVSGSKGDFALVKVGAFIVGSVQTTYGFSPMSLNEKGVYHETLSSPFVYQKGEEIGHFEFGSTVILLFDKNHIQVVEDVKVGTSLKFGQKIAYK